VEKELENSGKVLKLGELNINQVEKLV